MTKDYYKILGVDKNTSKEDIKKAYKQLAKKFHPDINKAPDAQEKFKEISEAAAVLTDDKKKQQYDQYGTADFGGGGFNYQDFASGADFSDIFEDLLSGFGFNFSGGRRSRTKPGNDLLAETHVTLEEVATGVTKEIKFKTLVMCEECNGLGGTGIQTCESCNGAGSVRKTQRTPFGMFSTSTTCSDCHGSGKEMKEACTNCDGEGRIKDNKTVKVKIPEGVEDNTRLRVQEAGEAGEAGAPAGDLYVIVHVQEHETFERRDNDLWINKEVPFAIACLGGEMEVPTLIDGNTKLKIPAGTEDETVLRLKGKGLPSMRWTGRGDQNIKISIEVPKKLNKKQKELLEEFQKSLGKKKGWFF
ncbi:molecular chaperone DnaJ [Candidatus Woesearchaeota archaeon]|nr:molecular chaperone DnaJ [Candidatus Woesearchaeota archaeon]